MINIYSCVLLVVKYLLVLRVNVRVIVNMWAKCRYINIILDGVRYTGIRVSYKDIAAISRTSLRHNL